MGKEHHRYSIFRRPESGLKASFGQNPG